MDFLNDFAAAMAAQGFRPKNALVADDKWHDAYYGNEKGNKLSGTYTLKIVDGAFAIGCFFTRKDPDTKYPWHSQTREKLTMEERGRIKRQIEQAQRERDEKEMARQKRMAKFLTAYYNGGKFCGFKFHKLPRCDSHAYLTKKDIAAHGVKYRAKDKSIVVPFYQIDGQVWQIQRILPNGKKYLMAGARKKGSYFPFANADDDFTVVLLCEGYSTGASIRQATKMPTVACIDAGNIKPVIQSLKKKFPNSRFVICADNDEFTRNAKGELWNVGIQKANEAALAIGGASVVWPIFSDNNAEKKLSDFNDLHAEQGLAMVKDQIMDVVNSIPAAVLEEAAIETDLAHYANADQQFDGGDNYPPNNDERDYAPDMELEPIAVNQGDFGMKFRCLGCSGDLYYYFSYLERRIVALTATQHTLQNLLQLDTLEAWENSQIGIAAKSEKKIGLYAFNMMRELCAARGKFAQEDNVRGGGAWLDDKRIIVNAGDRLFVDGAQAKYDEFKSDNTYVASPKFMKPAARALTNPEAVALRKICESVTWKNPLSGSLLAGWLVIAPVCGALDYRPHLWITGEAESGKSTVIKRIVRGVLGRTALNYEGGTTEAKLRQSMGHDARPLVYDEAEPSQTMTGVIELARGATTGAVVGKYGQGDMRIRFAACFSSINPPVDKTADESRISFLVIKKNNKPTAIEDYERLLDMIETHITPDFGDRLLARTIKYLDVLFANIRTFQAAARRVIKGARASEQIGTMIAGLYLLHSTDLASPKFAEDWIRKYDWREHTTIDGDSDPTRMVQHLAGYIVKLTTGGGTRETNIGELIVAADGNKGEQEDKTLRMYGIKVQDKRVYIASRSAQIAKIFGGTDWSKKWANGLSNLDGAMAHSIEYFSPAIKTSAVSLPLDMFTDTYQTEIKF